MGQLVPGYPVASDWCGNLFVNPPGIKTTFSRAVNPATVSSSTLFLTDPVGAVVPGTYTYSADLKTVTLTPTGALTADPTAYNVHVTSGLKDFSGAGATPVVFPVTVQACSAGSCASPTFGGSYPNTFAAGPVLSLARSEPMAALTQSAGNFRALVMGGFAGGSSAVVDAYAWNGTTLALTKDVGIATPMQAAARSGLATAVTLSGCDIVMPGTTTVSPNGPNLYSSGGNAWTRGVEGGSGNSQPVSALVLPSGKVFYLAVGTGPFFGVQPQIYDPGTNLWAVGANAPAPYNAGGASAIAIALLNDGRVLISGGSVGFGTILTDSAIYDPVGDTWSIRASMNVARQYHRMVTFNSGHVVAIGGLDSTGSTALASCEVFDPVGNTWTPIGSMSVGRWNHEVCKFPTGQVFVLGGTDGGEATVYSSTEILSAGLTWAAGPAMTAPRFNFAVAVVPDATQYTIIASGGSTTGFAALASTDFLNNPTGGPVPGGGPPA